ncbi:MAG: serine/threonine-protein phosphatase, partial [Rhodobacteraceae bacterium]|nr:serine/threonine-protein phosphatase [Paracoccaceae bacterium]
GVLHEAVQSANECIRMHAETNPDTQGMGTTLVAPVIVGNNLYWISVGDSPLYLLRRGELIRLNQDHSMEPQIEYLVATGAMTWEAAANHPDRNSLTSVLIGDDIPQIDCPSIPVRLKPGDIVLAASDGLQFLADEEIAETLQAGVDTSSAEIIAALMRNIEDLDDPDQDNIALCVIRVVETVRPVAKLSAVAAVGALQKAASKRQTTTFVATAATTGHGITYRVSMEKSA